MQLKAVQLAMAGFRKPSVRGSRGTADRVPSTCLPRLGIRALLLRVQSSRPVKGIHWTAELIDGSRTHPVIRIDTSAAVCEGS